MVTYYLSKSLNIKLIYMNIHICISTYVYKLINSVTITLNYGNITLKITGKRLGNLYAYFEVFVSE